MVWDLGRRKINDQILSFFPLRRLFLFFSLLEEEIIERDDEESEEQSQHNANNAMKRATMMLLVIFSFALFANAEKRHRRFIGCNTRPILHVYGHSSDYLDDEVSTITLRYNVHERYLKSVMRCRFSARAVVLEKDLIEERETETPVQNFSSSALPR